MTVYLLNNGLNGRACRLWVQGLRRSVRGAKAGRGQAAASSEASGGAIVAAAGDSALGAATICRRCVGSDMQPVSHRTIVIN